MSKGEKSTALDASKAESTSQPRLSSSTTTPVGEKSSRRKVVGRSKSGGVEKIAAALASLEVQDESTTTGKSPQSTIRQKVKRTKSGGVAKIADALSSSLETAASPSSAKERSKNRKSLDDDGKRSASKGREKRSASKGREKRSASKARGEARSESKGRSPTQDPDRGTSCTPSQSTVTSDSTSSIASNGRETNKKSMMSKIHMNALSEELFESIVTHRRGRKHPSVPDRTRSVSVDDRTTRTAYRRVGVLPGRSCENLSAFLRDKKLREKVVIQIANIQNNASRSSPMNDSMSEFSLSSGTASALQLGTGRIEQENQQSSLNALVYRLRNPELEEELVGLFKRIQDVDGFPLQRRAPMGSNHITEVMCQTLRNDPDCMSVLIDDPIRFKEVERTLPLEFAEGLRANVHVTSLTIQGLSLDDEFLGAIGNSIRQNFTLQSLILSGNCFTSAGLADFCWCLGVNDSLWTVDLTNQQNNVRLLEEHEKDATAALANNTTLCVLRIDVATKKCKNMMKMIEERNSKERKPYNYDMKLVGHFREEADRAERLFRLNLLEEKLKHNLKKEWTMLSNLATIAAINKIEATCGLNNHPAEKKLSIKNLLPEEKDMSLDGSFLDAKFISKFFESDRSSLGLKFNFKGQSGLFAKFGPSHKARKAIVSKFVDALLGHKKINDTTQIIMANCGCGDDFVVVFCHRCLGNPQLLPKLFSLDLSGNHISDDGITALSECISDKHIWRYVQVIRIQDQICRKTGKKTVFSPESEYALARAVCQNLSLVSLSVKIEGLQERCKVRGFLERNLDLLEQARTVRRRSSDDTSSAGDIRQARNEMEQQIDRLAANDPAIWRFEASGDQRFLSLKRKDVKKLAKGLAHNKFVTEVRLDRCELDDDFAILLGESLATNSSIRVLSLECNAIGPKGIKGILYGIGKNETLVEVQLRDQAVPMLLQDEVELVPALGDNRTIRKLGIDISTELVSEELDKKLRENQQSQYGSGDGGGGGANTHRQSLPSPTSSSRERVEDYIHRRSMD